MDFCCIGWDQNHKTPLQQTYASKYTKNVLIGLLTSEKYKPK